MPPSTSVSTKRARSPTSLSPPPLKRLRPDRQTYITQLSDELLLRIASFLETTDLVALQLVSKRCQRIAVDGHIWKALFYGRFVRPRASRIPGLSRLTPATLHYSARNSKWLEDEGLARDGNTNWKELYKLRHNWNMGNCGVDEIDISETPTPLLVKLHEGIVYIADTSSGLQAWNLRGEGKLIAKTDLYSDLLTAEECGMPTAMAVDEESSIGGCAYVTVGFDQGRFAVYQLDMHNSLSFFKLRNVYHPRIENPEETSAPTAITAMAFLGHYIATVSASQSFVIYKLQRSADNDTGEGGRMMRPPKVLASLRSHTVWPPLSLSLRRSVKHSILASIAYAYPLYASGWSVGIQELRLGGTMDGDALGESRIATATPAGFTPLAFSTPSSGNSDESQSWSRSQSQIGEAPLARPTCVSYAHPYLLASHADNTLTLYLVRSTEKALSIDAGQRLWGHTSAVSTALVGGRGKAVSVATGGELRLWELEGGVSEKRRVNASVRVEPLYRPSNDVVDLWRPDSLGGFDFEKVVVLRDKGRDKQVLVVYDFSR